MKLKKLILNNFQSFQNAEIDFENLKIISIIGKYTKIEKRSNGSGKSTIFDSIIYALYGKSRTKREDDLIRENTSSMNVELEFELSQKEIIKINRGKENDKGYLNLEINGIDKTLGKIETQKLIESKIGMDFDLFVATVFFQQEGADKFTAATPTERKGYLKKLFGLEIYDKAYKKTNDKMKVIDNEINQVSGTINYLKEQIDGVNIDQIKEILEKKKPKFEKVKKDLESTEKEYLELIKSQKDISSLSQKIKDIEEIIFDLKESNNDLNTEIKENEKTQKELKKELLEVENNLKNYSKFTQSLLDITKKEGEEKSGLVGKKESDIESIDKEIEKLKVKKDNLKDEVVCSRCNTKLSFDYKVKFEDEINIQISDLIKQKDSLSLDLIKIKYETELLRDKYKQLSKDLKTKIDLENQKQKIELNINNLNKSIDKDKLSLLDNEKKLKVQEEKLNEFLSNFDKDLEINIKKKINKTEDKKEELKDKKEVLQDEIVDFENILKNYDKNKKEYKQKKSDYDDLNFKYNSLDLLKKIFGKNGIIADIIKQFIEEIEIESNNILKEINNSEYRIIFDTLKESKKGDLSDSLDIYIENNRAIRIYESYSGGQRSLINFAIRMALSRLLSKLNNIGIYGFIALDEVFGSLDDYNKNKMIDVINYLKSFFYQILVISHTDLKECFENNIEIEFNNNTGISKIKGIY